MADAVEAAAPAVANITVNVRFHAGRWTPTYATQSVGGWCGLCGLWGVV